MQTPADEGCAPVPELCCGKCGYNVRGLPSSICPECGSDLDVVGRVPARKERRKRIRRAILFAVLLAIGAGAATAIVYYTLIPLKVDRKARVWLFGPDSKTFVDLRMDFRSLGWRLPGRAVEGGRWQDCHLKLQRLDGSADWIVVDLANRRFRAARADGRAVGSVYPVNADTLCAWLSRNSQRTMPDTDHVRLEAETIVKVLDDAIACGPLFQWSRATRLTAARTSFSWSKSASGPTILERIPGSSFLSASFWRRGSAQWLGASKGLLIGLWALIWIGGLGYFLRWKRPAYARD